MKLLPSILLSLLAALVLWCSSGTLSPYANTHYNPKVIEPCQYLGNLDHGIFVATYDFVDGAPEERWRGSVALRRILYPLVAYYPMKWLGFMWGGLLVNVLMQLLALWALMAFVRKRNGNTASFYAGAIFALYPGAAYWGGLSYSYACIVPFVVFAFILLQWVWERDSLKVTLFSAFLMGVMCLGYDLLPFFGPALVFILLRRVPWRERFWDPPSWLGMAAACVLIVIPSVVANWVLQNLYGVEFFNSNSASFFNILASYIAPGDLQAWWLLLADMPRVLWRNYLDSNFLFLPICFLIAALVCFAHKRGRLSYVETCFALAILLVFLINNCAPPYGGRWQLRGDWIARLYQPLFVVQILYLSRVLVLEDFGVLRRRLLQFVYCILIVGNTLVIFGPFVGLRLTDVWYHNFYRHVAEPGHVSKNMDRYGARPLGFCKTS